VSEDPTLGNTWALPADPDDYWAWLRLPAERIALHHLGHIMMNIRDLPPWAGMEAEGRVEPVVIAACRDAFYTNVRLAVEFFTRPRDARDFRATDYLPSWVLPESLKPDLEEAWTIASQHVVHLSRERTPDLDPSDWGDRYSRVPADSLSLSSLGVQCYDALVAFTHEYEAEGGEYVLQFRSMVVGLRPFFRDREGKPTMSHDNRDDLHHTRDKRGRFL
jgi:hypothetical protein